MEAKAVRRRYGRMVRGLLILSVSGQFEDSLRLFQGTGSAILLKRASENGYVSPIDARS